VTRWLWMAMPLLVVTLLVPLGVAVAVTALTPAALLQTLNTGCQSQPAACPATTPTAGPADSSPAASVALAFTASKAGGPYRMGANGPHAYDCSSLT
jgi:cell wall-associated NlpC family hydrolase